VDARREQLVRMLHRRRRMRLLAVCVGTAVLCGAVAAILAPKVLVGDVPPGNESAKLTQTKQDAKTPRPGAVLDLDNRLKPDPRETRNNGMRWNALAEPQRRVFFERYWRLTALTPEEQDRLIGRYKEFRTLPAERQALLRQRAKDLGEFLNRLSPQDKAVLAGLSDEERAARLLELHGRSGRP